ncbi:MAG: sugar phosphate isomerase/epimerase [Planctomycetes bacterium]|nr:sugar phosphate isomerase/epimerase [Planctomycetota bacterium]
MKIALAVDDLRMEFKAALDAARRMGVRHVDVSATQGPVSRGELSKSGQRHLVRHLGDLGLSLDSLRGPAGGPGYCDNAAGERRLEMMRGVIELAGAIGVPVVSTTLGGGEIDGVRLKEAMAQIADFSDRCGVTVAIETSGMTTVDLEALLREMNCPHLAACCDTGAMLIQGKTRIELRTLCPVAFGWHACAMQHGARGAPGHETAVGQGQLDPSALLAGFAEAGYQGPLILTRQSGDNPVADLAAAKRRFDSLTAGPGEA